MACFPRLLRKKAGFNPSNEHIFLDKNETSVEIGRYIQREESPLIYENGKIRSRNKQTPDESSQETPKTVAPENTHRVTTSYTKKDRRAPLRPDNILVPQQDNNLSIQITSDTNQDYHTIRKQKPPKDNKPLANLYHEHSNKNEKLAAAAALTADNELKTVHPKPLQTPVYLEELKQKQNDLLPRNTKSEPNKVVIFVGGKQSPTSESFKGLKSSGFAVQLAGKAPPEAQVEVHTYPLEPYVEAPTLPLQPQAAAPATEAELAGAVSSVGDGSGGTSGGVDANRIQITMHHQKNNKTQTKINTRQDNELQQQPYHVEEKKPATSLGRDSGVQIEDTFESKDSTIEAPSRVEGGVLRARSKLSDKKSIDIEVFGKDESTRKLIRTAIEKNDFLNNYMDKDRKEMVIDAMEVANYAEGSYIIRENEEGSEIYVSEEGYYDVIKAGNIIGTIGPGTVFGELAILYSAKRFASIKAATKAKVWKIDRVKFRNIMLVSGYKQKEEYLQFLKSSPILKDLSNEVLVKLVDLLKLRFYPGNTCIVREGEVGNEFFIIRGGTVTIKKVQADGSEAIVAHRKRGDYFGEHAILNADVRQATVYADPPVTECLKLDRETVINYLGTIPQLREKPEDKPAERVSAARHSEFNKEYADIELGDLKKVATLGAGAFGRVDLVTHTPTSRTFALKILRKIDVIKQDQVEHVYSEKQVMMMCRGSPFIIQLYKTFRNDKFVYFLMEPCLGGDVWTIMSKRKYFDEKTARFIAACVVEAFEFLHSRNIIYRDLKPENLMLNNDGYCKLVDFGFAKRILENHKTNTFAGTPEYVAPEIILDRGHDKSVDYWALGILIFELLVGKSPFRGQNQIKIYQQILGGIDVIQMPSRIPKTAQGLIKQLCKQMPAERLGIQRKGILDIKRHSWFDGFDWKKLKAKTLPSPIKRPISSNTDLQYFEPCSGDNDEPPDETSGWDIDF